MEHGKGGPPVSSKTIRCDLLPVESKMVSPNVAIVMKPQVAGFETKTLAIS